MQRRVRSGGRPPVAYQDRLARAVTKRANRPSPLFLLPLSPQRAEYATSDPAGDAMSLWRAAAATTRAVSVRGQGVPCRQYS